MQDYFLFQFSNIMKRNRKRCLDFVMVVLLDCVLVWPLVTENQSDQIEESIRQRIESAGVPPDIVIGNEKVLASIKLPQFYEARTFQPAWCSLMGLNKRVPELVDAIRSADSEGLRPEDYHLSRIELILTEIHRNKILKRNPNLNRFVDLELLCTDAFLVYGAHLLAGKVNPETIDSEWFANRREGDLATILEEALIKKEIKKSLERLLPDHFGYSRMRKTLARFRAISKHGGWNAMPEGEKLQKGDTGESVLALRYRLNGSGLDNMLIDTTSTLFDESLESAVIFFQRTHGLDADGVVGSETILELNVPVEDRIKQLVVNMERWRWLPQKLGERYILVNIANFELDVVESHQVLMTMKVIIGKPYRKTPVFSDVMTYLVLNPYWTVPKTIATQDILPEVQKDVHYLTEKKIRVFQGWGANTQEVDPDSVEWSAISAKQLPYWFRQDPGSQSALGRIKFMFPNRFDVYLHDTPSQELFTRKERAFSSGCIRIEKPLDLAEYLLRDDPKWTRKQILNFFNSGIEETVRLPEPTPIHILYWTAWIDEDDTVNFRKDVYGRDKSVLEALTQSPSSSESTQ